MGKEKKKIHVLLIVMGTSGSGKSTVAKVLADRLNATFVEGDDFHSQENKSKMAAAIPLQDEDRWPWLKDIKTNIILEFSAHEVTQPKQDISAPILEKCNYVVLSCSSLKKSYRQFLLNEPGYKETFDDPENPYHTLILYLKGSYDLILERLKARKNHFAGPGLLQSQFKTLEEPSPEDENVVDIPISEPLSVIHDLSFDAATNYASSLFSNTL